MIPCEIVIFKTTHRAVAIGYSFYYHRFYFFLYFQATDMEIFLYYFWNCDTSVDGNYYENWKIGLRIKNMLYKQGNKYIQHPSACSSV